MSASTWWFVSDLHLEPGRPDTRGTDQAFADFVDRLVLPSRGRRNLVLLGDTFEVRRGAVRLHGGVEARVRQTVASFPGVFGALRRCLMAGVEVHLVCGNHDYLMMSPPHQAVLAQELDRTILDGGAGRLRVHPWVLHEPGLFYAEHGNQHHELNRLPALLTATGAENRHGLAPTPLEAWAEPASESASVLTRLRAVAGSLRASGRAERATRDEEYVALIRQHVGPHVTDELLRELHGLSAFSLGRAVARTAHRMTLRTMGRPDHDSYLRVAAGRIDALLSRHGERPLCYVFGHTHVETLEEVGRGGAWYANTGTWSRHVRRPEADLRHFPYVVVSGHREPAQRSVRLEYWDSVAGTVVRGSAR